MRTRRSFTGLAIAFSLLLFSTLALANERQVASPIWADDDEGDPGTFIYHMAGLDFDAETPGLELPDEQFFSCFLVPEGGGMVRVSYVARVRFRDAADGSDVFTTGDLQVRSQPFPDPFDSANQDMSGQLLHAYLTNDGDQTAGLQSAVLLAADPTDTLCETFPNFGPFGINIATTSSGTERSIIFADSLTGGYALKTNPSDPFWDGVNPMEGIGAQKYWSIEASSGAGNKGSVLGSKAFNEQFYIFEATPGWMIDPEFSMVGDMLGTGDDVIRITDLKETTTPGTWLRRIRHFNVRTGALVGTAWQHPVLD